MFEGSGTVNAILAHNAEVSDAAANAYAAREAVLAVARQVGRMTELYQAMAALQPASLSLDPATVLEEARAIARIELARRVEERRQGRLPWPFALNAMDDASEPGRSGQ